MILELKLSKLKNIMFFKFILILSLISLFFYLFQIGLEQKIANLDKYEQARNLYELNNTRLTSLKQSEQNLLQAINAYFNLHNSSVLPKDCFDQLQFHQELTNLRNKYNLQSPIQFFISNNSLSKKSQLKTSITLKATTITIKYYINSYFAANLLAKDIFKVLPQHTLVKSFEIIDYETVTPQVLTLLYNKKQTDLVEGSLTVVTREINLR